MSAIPFLNNVEVSGYLKILASSGYLDLDKNELRNAVIQNLGTEPASPNSGQAIYNTVKNHFGYWNGTAWIYPGENSDQLDGQHGAYYLARANHTGTQLSTTISDFDEAAQDAVGGILTDTNSVDMTYDDGNNQIKADVKVVAAGGIEIQATGIQLTATGVGAGTYTKVTVDVKGRVTTATNLVAGDLPTHNHSAADITTGILAVARGGTNLASYTANTLLYASGTTTLASLAAITANRALISSATGLPTASAVTNTELGYVSGVTSAIQTQLNGKAATSHTHTASQITDFDTQVRTNRLDQMATPTASVSLGNQKITNLAEPTLSSDAATKNYVDSVTAGLKWKNSVKVATTANITLTAPQTIDGVSVIAGDRVLVKNQTTANANGIYVVAAGAWTRSTDTDAWAELVSAAVFVESGTTQADSAWTCTSDAGGTLGTTSVTWTTFAGTSVYTASLGVQKVGSDFRAAYETDSIELNGNNFRVKVDTTKSIERTASGLAVKVDGTTIIHSGGTLSLGSIYQTRKYAADITGNGALVDFAVTHSFNTKDIQVEVWDVATSAQVFAGVVANTVNQVTVSFAIAPVMSKVYRVVVIG